MLEKRRCQRIPLQALQITLQVCDPYNPNPLEPHRVDDAIKLTNLSEYGIGFISKYILPIGYHFHALLNLGTGKDFFVTMAVVRSSDLERDRYDYGCEFIAPDASIRNTIRNIISTHPAAAIPPQQAARLPHA
ncbi:MAG: PilZ domain-containing protein [Lachnospiraceae bacterium]|nr:PilZ domain-containing protein [Lachnospiraceae bacterium]